MPNIASTFDEKQCKIVEAKAKFKSNLITIFPKFTKALNQKSVCDKNFKINDYITQHIETDYSPAINFTSMVNIVSNHYQEKYSKTQKPEYNIKILDIDLNAENNGEIFKNIIENNTPTTENPQGIVIFDKYVGHATPALLMHDNKIMVLNLSNFDQSNQFDLEACLEQRKLDKQIVSCTFNSDNNYEKTNPQKDRVSCVIFAFKYLKLLCRNNYELYKKIKPSPFDNDTYILPPELLRYSQSDTLIIHNIDCYSELLELSQGNKEEITKGITDYRDTKFDKFRILYHNIKNYTGNAKKQSEMITHLKTLTTDLETENSRKR